MTTFELIDSKIHSMKLLSSVPAISILTMKIKICEPEFNNEIMILKIIKSNTRGYNLIFNDINHMSSDNISDIMKKLSKLKFSKDILLTIQGELLKLL